MSLLTPVRPAEPIVEQSTQPIEVLIREARRRQRRRRLFTSGVVLIVAAAGFLAVKMTTAGPSTTRGRPAPRHSPVRPVPPVLSAGQFAGFWRFHTMSVTIQADGQGSVSWPLAGHEEALGLTSHANIRLTSVSGTHASAQIAGSSMPSEVPDGSARLWVTSQDLLFVVPAHRTEVSPFDPISYGPQGFCGPKALALVQAEGFSAPVNCGA